MQLVYVFQSNYKWILKYHQSCQTNLTLCCRAQQRANVNFCGHSWAETLQYKHNEFCMSFFFSHWERSNNYIVVLHKLHYSQRNKRENIRKRVIEIWPKYLLQTLQLQSNSIYIVSCTIFSDVVRRVCAFLCVPMWSRVMQFPFVNLILFVHAETTQAHLYCIV